MLDRSFDQWYGLVSFPVFGNDDLHKARILPTNKLFVTWEQGVMLYSIRKHGLRNLFVPIEDEYRGQFILSDHLIVRTDHSRVRIHDEL